MMQQTALSKPVRPFSRTHTVLRAWCWALLSILQICSFFFFRGVPTTTLSARTYGEKRVKRVTAIATATAAVATAVC